MKRLLRAGTLLIILGLLIYLLASSAPGDREEPSQGHAVYYLDVSSSARGSDALRPCVRDLGLPELAAPAARAVAVVERLLEDPPEDGLRTPLPGVRLLDLTIRDQCAYVDLSQEFSLLSGVDLTLADYCLTLSLTGLADVSAVAITVQGQPVGHQPKPIFYDRDVLLSTMEDVFRTVSVTLYFPNESGALTPESRTLQLYEGQTLAEGLLAALQEGPADRSLLAVVPRELSYYSVRVDGEVCTLNLVSDSLSALPEDPGTQALILESITRTLCSMDAVRELRLTADGEPLSFFGLVPLDPEASDPPQ